MSNDRSLFSRAPKSQWGAMIAIASWLATACVGAEVPTRSAPGATASGSAAAPESPSASPGLSASPSMSPSVGPTAATPGVPPSLHPTTQAPSASPAGSFDIQWQRQPANFGSRLQLVGSAVVDDRIVVIGAPDPLGETFDAPTAAIWWEDGDLVWRPADLPATGGHPWLSTIVAGGRGLMVAGTEFEEASGHHGLVWLSSNGTTWESAAPTGLDDDVWNGTDYAYGPTPLAVADDGLVLLGRDAHIGGVTYAYVSDDGREWQLAGTATQDMANGLDALVGSREELSAFERRIDSFACGDVTGGICKVGPVRVWRAAGADDWQLVGQLPDSDDGFVTASAVGPKGWVVAGSGAWFSADGVRWHRADTSPRGALTTIFALNAGFVGVGGNEPELCPPDCATTTWTSPDGQAWRLANTMEGTSITSIRRRGATLIGIGMDGQVGAVWTAQLP